MTTFFNESVTCGACRQVFIHQALASVSIFSAPESLFEKSVFATEAPQHHPNQRDRHPSVSAGGCFLIIAH